MTGARTAERRNEHSLFWKEKLRRFDGDRDSLGEEDRRNCRIMKVLIRKFAHFVAKTDIVKLDGVSRALRPHLMDKVGVRVDDGSEAFRVSLKKIQAVFVNVEEVYLYNYYRLDDALLAEIIAFLKMPTKRAGDAQESLNARRLKQIKFLYYDYRGDIADNKHYKPTAQLDPSGLEQLRQLGWECVESAQRKKGSESEYGMKIRLKPIAMSTAHV